MTFELIWLSARQKLIWLAVIVPVFLGLALYIYATSSDRYVTEATITSKTSEDHSFDAGSLSGLAALAGGGQRPTFEQLGFLVQSSPVVKRILPILQRESPQLTDGLLGRSSLQVIRHDIEQSARSLFGKPLIVEDDTDRLVEAVRANTKITKTPEGFLKISFTNRIGDGQVRLVQGLLSEADTIIRQREQIDYITRVKTYQALISEQTRPAERTILISLIGREYSTYVAAQSGKTFSFEYIESSPKPRRVYTASLLVLAFASIFLALITYTVLILAYLWRRLP